MADSSVSKVVPGQSSGTRIYRLGKTRSEFSSYFEDLSSYRFSAKYSDQYWWKTVDSGEYLRLTHLARLFHTVPVPRILEEYHFSELERRCIEVRNRTKWKHWVEM